MLCCRCARPKKSKHPSILESLDPDILVHHAIVHVLVLGLAATAEYIAAAGRTAAAVQQRVAETSKHMAKSLT